MLTNDTHISDLQSSSAKKTIWAWIERALVFFVILTYSGFWITTLIGPGAENPGMAEVDPGPIARASWYPAYLFLIILLACSYRKLFAATIRFWPILLLFAWAISSVAWSIEPDITQRRVIALSFTFFFGMYLAIRAPFVETLKILAWAWFSIALINYFIIFLMPSWGVHSELHIGAWRGFLLEKNHLGGEMARANLIFLALVFYDGRKPDGDFKKIWWAGLILTLILVLGSTSKTALIALTAPYLGIAFYKVAIGSPILATIAVWIALSVSGIAYAILMIAPEVAVSLIGKDLTFTGRTDIWALVIDLINQHKWTGYGYAVFWKDPDGPSAYIVESLDWQVPTAHNSWLEIGLSLGYTGLIIAVLITLYALIKGAFLATGKHGPLPFLMVMQLVLFSLSESLLLSQNAHPSALFLFFLCYILIARKEDGDLSMPQLTTPYWAEKPRTTRKRW